MPQPSPHDWLRPRLAALVAAAKAAGIAPDVCVAVINDLINEAPYNTAPPETDDDWNRDPGEPEGAVNPGFEEREGDPGDAGAGSGGLYRRTEHFPIRRNVRRHP